MSSERNILQIEQQGDGTTIIEGTRYSNSLFREFGCSFPDMIGQVLRIDKKKDGLVTVTRLYDEENLKEVNHGS